MNMENINILTPKIFRIFKNINYVHIRAAAAIDRSYSRVKTFGTTVSW